MDVKNLLTHARTKLVLENPFFSSILLRLKMVEAPADYKEAGLDTFGTDGETIWYNPDWIIEKKLDAKQTTAVLAHEVLHVVLLHHTRRGHRDPQKWNYAADFAINLILQKNGFELPGEGRTLAEMTKGAEGYCLDPQFEGMSTEQIYEKTPDPPKLYVVGLGGVFDPNAKPGDKPGQGGCSASEMAEKEAEAQVKIAQAQLAAKQAGKFPAGLDRKLQNAMETKIDWRERLQKFFKRVKITESTWRKPNRRYLHSGIYLPTDLKEPTGTIVVVVDTSGSIGGPELDAFASEIQAIYQFANPDRLIVMYCDAAVGKTEEFKPSQGDQLVIKPVGGGGTDFRPPFSWLAKHDIVPEAFVYLTDGYGPFPDEPAEFPVLWVINNHSVTPPWGEHLILEL
jgi:predicted metal-dependent peptidase